MGKRGKRPRQMVSGSSRYGLLMGVMAYGLWGLFPIYWKQLVHVPPGEVLANRVLWSAVFALLLVGLRRQLRAVVALLHNPSARRTLFLSTALISVNWFLFIWAVANNRVTEASLGYYINPIFNVLIGRLFLSEKLSRVQLAAVGIAVLGVVYLTLSQGQLPWISLVLASSFAAYGVVRKRAQAGPLQGLAVETTLAAPFALAFLIFQPGPGHLLQGGGTTLWLVGAGLATSVPLLAFAAAARALRYATLGMVQFLAPTLQLGCAVLLYGEPFGFNRGVAFGCIWFAVGLYSIGALLSTPRAAG